MKPAYTKLAQVEGIEGEVILRLSIDTKGRVVKAVVVKKLGFGLDEAARKACLQWRYSPKTIDGETGKILEDERLYSSCWMNCR